MVANPSHWSVDFEAYLRYELEAEKKHELIDGEIVAMAGASLRHNVLCGRVHDAIRPSLGDGPCLLERSDQMLAVDTTQKGWVAYYPDLAVYCSGAVHPQASETRVNPSLLVEVTSKSTEKKDRGVKLEDYLQIPTLEEYVIVSHKRQELAVWTRGASGWAQQLVTTGTLRLRSGASIDVDRLFADLPALSER
ncbi:MAG: Uma2 family endonuclease [Labilithrix sp.]|nr:Uma2 family endonuclease [Labilithrix sp.]MCW5814157.1 Uma2 family endonuclease [Labilithrix sp.]